MKTHVLPVDFRLRNANDEAVLALGGARDLTLEIVNTSPTPLYLNPLNEQHHFSLRFRAGVLRDHHISLDKTELADWKVDTLQEKKHGDVLDKKHGDVLVQLRHKTPITWATGETLKLTLQGLRGEPAGGTRATRVELAYQHIRNKDGQGALVLVEGKPRHHQMVLTMPSPQESHARPLLEAHFVGETGNVVLNHGKLEGHALKLRLTNTTPDWLLVGGTTELRITLAAGARTAPGALATPEELLQYDVTASILSPALVMSPAMVDAQQRGWEIETRVVPDHPRRLPLDGSRLKDEPVWTFRRPENTARFLEIPPDGCLEIEIGNIVTGNANGPSKVHVHWLNLSHPHGDVAGEVVATIQKSPLVVVGQKVGIGTVPKRDGPDLESSAVRELLALRQTTAEAMALARKATRAVLNASLHGQVSVVPWIFKETGAYKWPAVTWDQLTVYWPDHGRVGIGSSRGVQRDTWRKMFEWCRRYRDPGPKLLSDKDRYFERSPHEVFYLHDQMHEDYPGLSTVGDKRLQFTGPRSEARSQMGLLLKPEAALHANFDPISKSSWLSFEDLSQTGANQPDNSVLIARWNADGFVTMGCDFHSKQFHYLKFDKPPSP